MKKHHAKKHLGSSPHEKIQVPDLHRCHRHFK